MTRTVVTVLCGLLACSCLGARPANAGSNDIDNPLLNPFDTPFGVPPFGLIRPEHFPPAFAAAMARHDDEVRLITDDPAPPTFDNTVKAYLDSGESLNTIDDIFDNLTGANTSDALQKIDEEVSPRLAAHHDAMTLNPRLFARVKKVHDAPDRPLEPAESFLLERLYRSFVLNGALLSVAEQETLKAINQELATLGVAFDNNVLAETNGYRLVIDRQEDLAGLPPDVIATAAATAAADGLPGKWVFTTHKPSMIPFLQYAQNRSLRETLYTAYTTRANHDDARDNKVVLARIIALRARKAGLLGFRDYASYRLQTSMAETPAQAFALLDQLWERSLAAARREAGELQAIIDREGGGFALASWDWWYYAEKLRKAKYDLDETEIRPYFRLENVRDGLFTVAGRLYGLTFTPLPGIPLPHPDAEAFEVQEADGTHRGVLYLDYYPRASKEGGAWCMAYRSHHLVEGREVAPVITVVCNLTRPTPDTPALLSMDDTETLFHEFGHALESLLSRVPTLRSYSATDFVELPSQIMEHWAFHPEALRLYARHYRTGESIPADLVDRIRNATLFNQGFATTEYLAASLLDLDYHSVPPGQTVDVAAFERDFLARRGVMSEIVPRYRSTYFSHIMGGYDAGYYGYIWAAVLDNDAFDAFAEHSIFDRATAAAFRACILERDGMADPGEMFRCFRGREPVVEPLLKQRGLR